MVVQQSHYFDLVEPNGAWGMLSALFDDEDDEEASDDNQG